MSFNNIVPSYILRDPKLAEEFFNFMYGKENQEDEDAEGDSDSQSDKPEVS